MTPGPHGPSKPSSNQVTRYYCLVTPARSALLIGLCPLPPIVIEGTRALWQAVAGQPQGSYNGGTRPCRQRTAPPAAEKGSFPWPFIMMPPEGADQKGAAAVYLQRQVFMLDGATGLPAHGAGPCRTSMPNRGGSVDSCEDRDRLLLLADTEEVVEAAQPSGAGLIPRGCALQRTSTTSVRVACG